MPQNMTSAVQTRTTATAAQQKPVDILKAVVTAESVQAQFRNALGEHKDTFIASLIDLYSGDKQLQQCKPAQVVAEALRAATLHLPLTKALGFSYIVVYNNSVKTPTAHGPKSQSQRSSSDTKDTSSSPSALDNSAPSTPMPSTREN